MLWRQKHPKATPDMLGLIPDFVSEADPRPAKEQFHTAYAHGGGWNDFTGFAMLSDGNMQYPGDPPTRLLYETQLRDETIRVYEDAWVAIIQPDGSFVVSSLD